MSWEEPGSHAEDEFDERFEDEGYDDEPGETGELERLSEESRPASPIEPGRSQFEEFRIELEATEGMLPPPSLLGRYEQELPGAGQTMLAEWQAENAHRRSMDRKVVDGQFRLINTGQRYGFLSFLAAVGAATYLLAVGKDVTGLIVMLGAIGGVITLFVFGGDGSKREDQGSSDER